MRYLDFREVIRNELATHAEGRTWKELKVRLALPYDRPCPTWVARLEKEIGLSRRIRKGREWVWRI